MKLDGSIVRQWGQTKRLSIRAWKRPLDFAFLMATLPGWLPLMLGIAAYIKLVSRGPVFFKQERIGFKGRRFLCLKFRTMKVDACAASHKDHVVNLIQSDQPMRKLDQLGDPRLIWNGAILRATGLDELPQLINVILGDMSFVGPRPCTPYEFEHYLPYHRRRCEALPGLTGLWQVSGKNSTTFSEMIRLDIYYVDYYSVWMDLKIIAKTFGVLKDQVRQVQKSP